MTDPPDIQIARYAVRTFNLVDERYCDLDDDHVVPFSVRILTGIYRADGQWLTGACEASCGKGHAHQAPAKECDCGIYGALSLKSLSTQFPQASRLVAVIAAEGTTIIGPVGLRTQYARVVAYWCSPDAKIERHQCATQFLDAQESPELAAMLEAHGISG